MAKAVLQILYICGSSGLSLTSALAVLLCREWAARWWTVLYTARQTIVPLAGQKAKTVPAILKTV
jgi:hypothetical protein